MKWPLAMAIERLGARKLVQFATLTFEYSQQANPVSQPRAR